MRLKDLLVEVENIAINEGTTYDQVKEMIDAGEFDEKKYKAVLSALISAHVKSEGDGYAKDLLQIAKEFKSKFSFLNDVEEDLENVYKASAVASELM